VIYIEGQNLFFAAVMCYYSPPPWIMSLWSLQQTRGEGRSSKNHKTNLLSLTYDETPRKKYHWSREYWMMYRGSNFLASPPPPLIMCLWNIYRREWMGEEPKSYIHSDPIKYTAKKRGLRRRSKSYNSFTFSYEKTPRKKYQWSREYWMMYRGSKFLPVSIIELPLIINNVSLVELISARGGMGEEPNHISTKKSDPIIHYTLICISAIQ
jgi:hypothetical protein